VIRVVLPAHLRTLARVEGEVLLHVEGPVTPRAVLDALEASYPMLRGTIRDHVTHQRRAFLRFFACEEDLSHERPDTLLPDAVATGAEPFLIVGAMAGGASARGAGAPRPPTTGASRRRRPILTYGLWVAQAVLALLFLWAGGVKLVLPLDQLARPAPLPGPFLRFIGVAEVLGAMGLILPGLLRLRPGLTPLAAAGLVIIMVGATAVTLASGDAAMALIPLAAGLLAVFVAVGRWRLAPHPGSPNPGPGP
jgi:uncharacterized membrane protein YphA (DoxX/SURF4 family)